MHPNDSGKRKPRRLQLNPEALEDRSHMTGGAGSMFAVLTGTVSAVGKPSQVSFTLDPAHFTLPKGKMELGIDVTSASGSTAKPVILSVVDSKGHPVHIAHSIYDPKVQRSNTADGSFTSAVIADVGFSKKNPTAPVTYTVDVMSQGTTSGNYLLGFYLPGDADGNGTVNQTDIKTIKSQLRSDANGKVYTFDADANRDGRITMADVGLATKNLGVSTTVNPTVSANLDPADDPGISQGTVTASPVHYTGVATPGATVTYQGTNQGDQPVSTVATASGNYSLYVPVDPGENVFKVSTHDAFNQAINGTITPVTYLAPTPVNATIANIATIPQVKVTNQ